MKKRELIRRWGILFLSFSLITGTASVPSYTVNAAEAGSYETGGGEIAPEPEPDPEPEPEPGGGGDDGGEDNSGTGGGGSPAQPGDDENGDDSGDDSGTGTTGGAGGGNTTGNTSGGNTGSTSEDIGGGGDTSDTTSTGITAAPEGNTGATSEVAALIEPVKIGEMDEPEGYKEAEKYNGTNEELIAQQHIVTDLPEIRRDFRFTTVDKVYAFSARETDIYEEQKEDSKVVGTIARNGILYELENEDNGLRRCFPKVFPKSLTSSQRRTQFHIMKMMLMHSAGSQRRRS